MNEYAGILTKLRQKSPLVHCITNFVTVNDCANILLASGASPAMTQDLREVDEAVEYAGALVCNLGTIEHVDSMIAAGKRANELGIPVVLDPVADCLTELRRKETVRLLQEVHFAAIRGNASEILFLTGKNTQGNGVDVSASDRVDEDNYPEILTRLSDLSEKLGSVIALSGKIDLICSSKKQAVLRNGCATMERVTGCGCMLTSLIGAYCAVHKEDFFAATLAAMASMGIAGERAEERRLANQVGNATFRNYLIDEVYTMTEEIFERGIRCEIYSG